MGKKKTKAQKKVKKKAYAQKRPKGFMAGMEWDSKQVFWLSESEQRIEELQDKKIEFIIDHIFNTIEEIWFNPEFYTDIQECKNIERWLDFPFIASILKDYNKSIARNKRHIDKIKKRMKQTEEAFKDVPVIEDNNLMNFEDLDDKYKEFKELIESYYNSNDDDEFEIQENTYRDIYSFIHSIDQYCLLDEYIEEINYYDDYEDYELIKFLETIIFKTQDNYQRRLSFNLEKGNQSFQYIIKSGINTRKEWYAEGDLDDYITNYHDNFEMIFDFIDSYEEFSVSQPKISYKQDKIDDLIDNDEFFLLLEEFDEIKDKIRNILIKSFLTHFKEEYLESPQLILESITESNYTCEKCDFSSFKEYSLIFHKYLNNHSKNKIYSCNYHNEGKPELFPSFDEYATHQISKHGKFKECTTCKIVLQNEDIYNSHIKGKKHKNKLGIPSSPKIKDVDQLKDINIDKKNLLKKRRCEICMKVLKNPDDLRTHKRVKHDKKDIQTQKTTQKKKIH